MGNQQPVLKPSAHWPKGGYFCPAHLESKQLSITVFQSECEYLNAFHFFRWRKLKERIRLLACKCSPYNYHAHSLSLSGLRNDRNRQGLDCLLQRATSWHHNLGVADHRLSVSSCKELPQKTSTGQAPHHSASVTQAATISGPGCPTPPHLLSVSPYSPSLAK